MEIKEIKTIDINAKEWYDKINGNSYFSVEIILNYNLKDCKSIILPFQYGYGEQYEYESLQAITKEFNIKFDSASLYGFCKENNIILRCHKDKNCLKKEVVLWGER